MYPSLTFINKNKMKNNIKNNNLTLKSLQAELNEIKANKLATQQVSKIQSLFSRSYIYLLLLPSLILTFANKIPFISKTTKLLSLWYGKTRPALLRRGPGPRVAGKN